ncbi:dimethylaniline monooxygenase (N-oxide forming) [Pseudovirgaria hyperparasitica]|uniref:Dimethylaniline monooxygenase (N-oxide forming) n=1 Tax=Pseudovirgaria hyperparasitica TaxID=470096 RepID=A0A6A6WK20_9PEZI|nr:dimethylaniline monooxygenase (N-oxide forming) [Pseudovirgaria hyperparasitica]KAF2762101.1 dimethylaniline monooxygenase (N-oxide forming) [Pseudovirgaria hyperparasitica]
MASIEVDSPVHVKKYAGEGAERSEPGSVNLTAASFPITVTPSGNVDEIAADIVDRFNTSLKNKDWAAIADLFHDSSYWRDHLVSTWDLRTIKGKASIRSYLEATCSIIEVSIRRGDPFQRPHFGPLDGVSDPQGITFLIDFQSKIGRGQGTVRLGDDGQGWKILTFFVTLQELKDFEEPIGHRRVQGVQHGGDPSRKNWRERRTDEFNFKDREPIVLIIGAGQAGLTASARFKMLGIPALAIDQNERVGDNWRKRYHQLVLHDPVWYDHMPYLKFPSNWPIFTPKDKLADFFEAYAKLLELNIWTRTSILSSKWDEDEAKWTVEVGRLLDDGRTEKRTFHPRHIIQATGHSGKKNFPSIKGMENFRGDRLCHSSEFSGAQENSKGKKAIVVGACNSSHDIAQDFYEKGYDVTMVQRSTTCVVSSHSITHIGLAGLYDENGPPVDDADLWLWGLPSELFKTQQARVHRLQRDNDKELLDGLEKAGFKVDKGPGDGGLFIKYFQRGGGYYIDVGASKLIGEGKIKVKQGQEIGEILEHEMLFADGTKLPADEIIFATGYQNMRTQAQLLFGDDVYNRTGDFWGFDEEGEFRVDCRRSGHPGFWYFGGNLAICRYFSRILALQIKAIETGLAKREPGGEKERTAKA